MQLLMRIYHAFLAIWFRLISLFVHKSNQQGSLRVLLYHDVDVVERDRFRAQSVCYQKSWNFISPDSFTAIIEGGNRGNERRTLLTFDDGFESNYQVAQDILNPLGISAIFFVVPEFVNTVGVVEQDEFVRKYIYPGKSKKGVPRISRSMTWEQIRQLSDQGHTIGSHTRTHARLSEIKTNEELISEIIDSGDEIERQIGVQVEHFAFTFGNLESFSPEALKVASQRYKYVYSGLRGGNDPGVSPFAIRREAIEPKDLQSFGLGVLSGIADFQYRRATKILDEWVREISQGAQ